MAGLAISRGLEVGRVVISGVTVTRDDETTVEYRFAAHRNRNRFECMLRFEALDDETLAEIMQRYDAYFGL